ncbi:Flagellar assembly factor FliW [Solidesulfovibrio carbinoliphilus subsp. oakridgensis]|uniref:Flagellar assembly factor FliW n=1 Tax=Solidesulfovibrio carbinoliphilus subsp. oakridgensis TaxID=694327 RepID=G7QCP7_9BACT|nr:flagellar assembly protein FliW [Solidesulfovibrio carbinoliphilus]EHJ46203.1 Flagellar assembly factor FliW [Solidesulfovibrio carbinoliphilus subsp. oakridgensis]
MAKKNERVVETRLGRMSLPEDRVLTFPRGLIGFMGHREFTLIQVREESPFLVLQSLDDPKLGLLVADPYSFMTEYEVVIGDADRRLLGIETREQATLLVTVTIPQGMPERTTLNLSGPIVLNNEARIGLQIPQTDSRYPAHYTPGMVPTRK